MIDAKHAAATAIAYYRDLMGENKITDVLLEEIELTNDEDLWLVTLSALVPMPKEEFETGNVNHLAAILQPPPKWRRIFKVFKINADTGDITSMKMRLLPQ